MPPETVTTVSALSVPSADRTIIASTIELPRSRWRAVVELRCTSPPHGISSKLGIIRATAQNEWACGEVATPARSISLRNAVALELDQPTAAYPAALRQVGERGAQRELVTIPDVRDIRP